MGLIDIPVTRLGRICKREGVTKIKLGDVTLNKVPNLLSMDFDDIEIESVR